MYRFAGVAAIIAAFACAPVAHAGPYSDDLSKCLVRSTSPDDQIVFIQWMFSAISLHPAVGGLASISPEQHLAFDKKAAALFVRLMSVDCHREAIDAIKYEGSIAIQTSFRLFGEVAMRGLMSNALVAEGLKGLGKHFEHDENWISTLREGGISPGSPSRK